MYALAAMPRRYGARHMSAIIRACAITITPYAAMFSVYYFDITPPLFCYITYEDARYAMRYAQPICHMRERAMARHFARYYTPYELCAIAMLQRHAARYTGARYFLLPCHAFATPLPIRYMRRCHAARVQSARGSSKSAGGVAMMRDMRRYVLLFIIMLFYILPLSLSVVDATPLRYAAFQPSGAMPLMPCCVHDVA